MLWPQVTRITCLLVLNSDLEEFLVFTYQEIIKKMVGRLRLCVEREFWHCSKGMLKKVGGWDWWECKATRPTTTHSSRDATEERVRCWQGFSITPSLPRETAYITGSLSSSSFKKPLLAQLNLVWSTAPHTQHRRRHVLNVDTTHITTLITLPNSTTTCSCHNPLSCHTTS